MPAIGAFTDGLKDVKQSMISLLRGDGGREHFRQSLVVVTLCRQLSGSVDTTDTSAQNAVNKVVTKAQEVLRKAVKRETMDINNFFSEARTSLDGTKLEKMAVDFEQKSQKEGEKDASIAKQKRILACKKTSQENKSEVKGGTASIPVDIRLFQDSLKEEAIHLMGKMLKCSPLDSLDSLLWRLNLRMVEHHALGHQVLSRNPYFYLYKSFAKIHKGSPINLKPLEFHSCLKDYVEPGKTIVFVVLLDSKNCSSISLDIHHPKLFRNFWKIVPDPSSVSDFILKDSHGEVLSADTLKVPPDAKFTPELNSQLRGSFVFLDLLVEACHEPRETRANFKFVRVDSAAVKNASSNDGQPAPVPSDDEQSWGNVRPEVPLQTIVPQGSSPIPQPTATATESTWSNPAPTPLKPSPGPRNETHLKRSGSSWFGKVKTFLGLG